MLHVVLSFWATVSVLLVNMDNKQTTYETIEGGYGEIQEQIPVYFTRSKFPLAENIICFMCNTKRNVDNNQYKQGGITRCSLEATAEKLLQKSNFI